MRARWLVCGVLAACFLLLALPRSARARKSLAFFPARIEWLRVFHYAQADRQTCLAELDRRQVPWSEGPKVRTIDTPVRLVGPIRGVRYEHSHDKSRSEGPVMDCRLLLALDDLATIAGDRGISRIRYNSIHRRRWARRAGERHPAGVAIDIVELVKHDGTVLNVREHYAGNGIGSKTCGSEASVPREPKARELRQLVCAVDRAAVFNLLLTPHYDYRHDDHFHFEVRRGIRWRLTQ